MKIKDICVFVYLILFICFLYFFVNLIQVPIDYTNIPDYVDNRLPNIKRYDCTIAIIDRNGIEHHYMMDGNGEPIFDIIDYTDPIYRDYLSYKKR